jgi:hypothetical protein
MYKDDFEDWDDDDMSQDWDPEPSMPDPDPMECEGCGEVCVCSFSHLVHQYLCDECADKVCKLIYGPAPF